MKSVFYDVMTFMYYLLVHTDSETNRRQIVGFFSKEKLGWDNNNLACILIFPPWQKRGLGQILMGVSYELSKRERKLGGPERRKLFRFSYYSLLLYPYLRSHISIQIATCIQRLNNVYNRLTRLPIKKLFYSFPKTTALSELGQRAYLAFWSATLARYIIANLPDNRRITIKEISEDTYILPDDVIATFKEMNVLDWVDDIGNGDGDRDGKNSRIMSSTIVIKKANVRAWMAANGVGILAPVDERYFRQG